MQKLISSDLKPLTNNKIVVAVIKIFLSILINLPFSEDKKN